MNVFPLQNANSSVISVTGTASYILPLVNTAGAVTHAFPPGLDALDITPENGDIRIVIDPSTTAVSPTASKGFLIKQGATLMLRHSSLTYIKAIATSGTVSCSLQVGESESNETTVISGGGSGGTGTGASQVQGNAASGATDVGNPVKTGGKYNVTPPVGTDGQRLDTQMDVNANTKTREAYAAVGEDNTNGVLATAPKPLATNTYAWTRYINLGAAATANVKASPGNVYSIYCRNINAAVRYIQLHDTATTPAPGAVPLYTFLIPASGSVVIDAAFFGEMGASFASGIAFAFSTTETTYTAGTAGEQTTICMYK